MTEQKTLGQRIWDTLLTSLGNPYGAAGMMGNLYAESALNSINLQNSFEKRTGYTDETYTEAVDSGAYGSFVHDGAGYGLAQWTHWSRKEKLLTFAKAQGKSIGDLDMQLDFLVQELGGYASVMQALQSAESVKAASDAVLTGYERPANQSDSVKTKRAAYGQAYYDRYAANDAAQGEENQERSDNNMLTNLQLAAFCASVHDAKWAYWYGTYGNKCTLSKYDSKAKQYPIFYTNSRKAAYMKDIAEGRTCADCVGLIKAFFWTGGDVNATPKYASGNCPDKGADSMFALCDETGTMATLPNIPGLLVWKSGHIGVYIGDGYTVEMKSFSNDCVKAKVKDGSWTKWGKLPSSMMVYVDESAAQEAEQPVKTEEEQPIQTAAPSAESTEDGEKSVVVKSNGGKVNIRLGNGTTFSSIVQLSPGTVLPYVATAENGWHAVQYQKQVAWISGQYAEVRG